MFNESPPHTFRSPSHVPKWRRSPPDRSLRRSISPLSRNCMFDSMSCPFVGRRMKHLCLAFELGLLSFPQTGLERVCRARTAALGIVGIRTKRTLLDRIHYISFTLGSTFPSTDSQCTV
ncbi:hypothetical protein JVT61DRAFT_13269 [Boletus reticuloceps]|uniref:Uncharacterized protein n=1 Tax=Boletus reticuloceps TaxID=495285 RepID=A0A8I3AE28_9AGAM|nr:hypothetical protein JVT61DRAFT_13269 [Boletus reticuloceps]